MVDIYLCVNVCYVIVVGGTVVESVVLAIMLLGAVFAHVGSVNQCKCLILIRIVATAVLGLAMEVTVSVMVSCGVLLKQLRNTLIL